jgi:hypothetical protein
MQSAKQSSYLIILNTISIYIMLRYARSGITKKNSTITLIGIPLIIVMGYMITVVIHNTFAL